MTVQPTAQCVQMLLRMVTVAPLAGGGPALAFCTLASGKRAERGEAAGGKTRPAQEGAAVEAVVVLAGEGGETTAARLTFCPFDQHGRASLSSDSG